MNLAVFVNKCSPSYLGRVRCEYEIYVQVGYGAGQLSLACCRAKFVNSAHNTVVCAEATTH